MALPQPGEQAIFDAARRIDAPEARRLYVEDACGGDRRLRVRVEALLGVHERNSTFLRSPTEGSRAGPAGPAREAPGTVVGPYELLRQIGEGGMGTVFLAEQSRPVRRQVALKLLKQGMGTRQVVARFEAERQALAIMDHPNIAKIFDGGATASGRPYFVMELVQGVPITEFCDQNHLAPRHRLELFVSVCHAVQHAHQKGIIHRDLKPSNVLVSRHDTTPTVKVIDFGVAKALGQELTDKTLVTGLAQMIGTPLYMSPEQAGMSDLDVDTRSDIYSLGVLLYELLAGTTPFDRERFKQAGYDEIRRIIREEEPPKPSTRLSQCQDTLASISANRHMEPVRLTKLVRGELDWIVMKALEKDRNRRYETANGFAMDIQRYLADEPVQACPPSAGYRLRKFARRHRSVLAAALAFVLLLVTAVVTLTVALVAVNRERQEKEAALESEGKRRKQARAALDAMSSLIIEDWLAKQPGLLPVHKQFLEQALRSYEEFAADTGQQEESRSGVAHAYRRVGNIRDRLGQRQDAAAAWERSRQLYAGLVADFPDDPVYRVGLARVNHELGVLYRDTSLPQEAKERFRQARSIHEQLVADFPGVPSYREGLALILNDLGILHKNNGQAREAEEVYGQAQAILKLLVAEAPTEPMYRYQLAQTLHNQGGLLEIARRPQEAVASLSEAVAIYKQLCADSPTVPSFRDSLARSHNSLGNALRDADRNPEAEAAFRQTLTTRKQLVVEFPGVPEYRRGLAVSLNNLGILFKNTGRAPEAEELYGQALAIHKQLVADFPGVPDHQNEAAGAMVNLARLLLARKEFQGARKLLDEAVPYHQAALKSNPRHPTYRNFYRFNRWRMAETLVELKDHAAAATAAQEFLQAATEPPRDAYTAAGMLAGCVRLAAQDERLGEIKRQELATTYGDSAVAALRQAIEEGAKEVTEMTKDPSLDPLRSRQDFQKLLGELEAKKKR